MTTRVDPVMHDQTRTSRSILALVAVARVGVGAKSAWRLSGSA
jgi:hypothetical protein